MIKPSKSYGEIVYIDIENLPDYDKHGREVRFICPVCEEEKRLEGRTLTKKDASINKITHKGVCHNCETRFRTREYNELNNISDENKHRSTVFKVYEYPLPISPNYVEDKECFDYFINRCPQYYTRELGEFFDLKYLKNKILIPFYYQNKNIYYQLRYIKPPEGRSKYFMPIAEVAKPPFVCYESSFNPTIIVEGVFDAIAIASVAREQYNIVAVLGKSITPYIYKYINTIGGFGPVKIFMDKTEISWGILKDLKVSGWRGTFKIYETSGEDPEEMLNRVGKDEFLKFLNS